jgi:hypothetical protein
MRPRLELLAGTIVVAVLAAVVPRVNWHAAQDASEPLSIAPAVGMSGGPATSAEGLRERISEMEQRLRERPHDRGAAVLLADALLRQGRVIGDGRPASRASELLKTVLKESPGYYDALRMLGAIYLLQQCARVGQSEFRLWGLNQENYGAAGLVLSRVLASRVGKEARSAMQQLLQKNEDAYRKALQSGSIFDLFMIAADDKELAGGAALLQKDGNPEARSLFASLVEGHEINRRPPAEYGNARRRERLMKRLFAANYARAASTSAAPPKVLLKFGAYHVYRGLNPVHGSGIGNYVGEFAEGQGAQSLHIYLLAVKGSQPIHPRVGLRSCVRSTTKMNLALVTCSRCSAIFFRRTGPCSTCVRFDRTSTRLEERLIRIWQRSSSATTSW